MGALRPHSSKPMYAQLAEMLTSWIQERILEPETPLPSEASLMRQYSVSRTTVRRAVGRLVRNGLAVRVQGKGTFVAGPGITQELVSLQTLNEFLTRVGLSPEIRVVDLELDAAASPQTCCKLQLEATEQIVRIKRQHLVKGLPIAFATICLSGHFQWHFTGEDLSRQSIYAWLEKEEHVSVESAVQAISATAADRDVARYLGIREGDPVLHVESTGMTGDGTPIDHTEFYFPPDRYAFSVRLRRTTMGVSIAGLKASQGNLQGENHGERSA